MRTLYLKHAVIQLVMLNFASLFQTLKSWFKMYAKFYVKPIFPFKAVMWVAIKVYRDVNVCAYLFDVKSIKKC